MKLKFYKYQGAGNDFILIDNRSKLFPIENRLELVKFLCHRKFGIGSDGIILLDNDSEYDFYMDFYNPDGSQSFCGNGSRCVVMFAFSLGMIENECSFKSIHGVNKARVVDELNICLDMFDVSNIEVGNGFHYMNTGSPHYNIFVNDLNQLDIVAEAKKIRYNERFKEVGTNVNFIQKENDHIIVRTYERGVEDETWSCGTGVTACAISMVIKEKDTSKSAIKVKTKGGDLTIKLKTEDLKAFHQIQLIGPAKLVFEGTIDV